MADQAGSSPMRSGAPMSYAAAGVDIDAKSALINRLKPKFRATHTEHVLADVGLFGGLIAMPPMADGVLVSSIDGVGTKTKVAQLMRRYDVIGHDIVSHTLNDIAVQGARGLFFLDYVAASKLDPDVFEPLVGGMADACKRYGVALIGGETAEMPGVYTRGEFDVVGCGVGVVERADVRDGTDVRADDVLIGLASTGLHTNGYTLARAVLLQDDSDISRYDYGLEATIGDALLWPHRCYAGLLLELFQTYGRDVVVAAHITGGGIPGNVVRVLPSGTNAVIDTPWLVPPLFELIRKEGNLDADEMMRTFNNGVGMVVIARPRVVESVIETSKSQGVDAFVIGHVEASRPRVALSMFGDGPEKPAG